MVVNMIITTILHTLVLCCVCVLCVWLVKSLLCVYVISYSQDVYIVNLVVQCIVIFSDYGWLLYLLLPTYVLYKAAKLLFNWASTPSFDEMNNPAYQKKQEKLERKMQRGQVKVVRR